MIAFEMIPTFEIVESPIFGDPLAALREQEAAQKQDWRTILDQHIKEAIAGPRPSWAPQFGSSLHTILMPQSVSMEEALCALMHDLAEDGIIQ